MRARSPAILCVAMLAVASVAGARTSRDQPFSQERTWNAAIRLIRVDFGCAITERDAENGYFTFDWRDGRRTVPGSLEVVPTQVDGRPGTRVIVQISAMPGYVESMVLTRLRAKLISDYGEPPPPPRPPQTPPRSDPPLGSPDASVPIVNPTPSP